MSRFCIPFAPFPCAGILAGMIACVPASEPRAPAGAAGFVTEPTAASRGEPFVTDDGWTIRFEELALQAFVLASPVDPSMDDYSAGAESYLWNGRDRVELYAPGVRVGLTRTRIELVGRSLPYQSDGEDIDSLGVDPRLAARFGLPSDDYVSSLSYVEAPALVFVVRAQKDDRVIRLDLSLGANRGSKNTEAALDVRENGLATMPLAVVAENLFRVTEEEGGGIAFEPFANADDGDGVLTPDELRAAKGLCPTCPDADEGPPYGRGTLLDILGSRVDTVVRTGEAQP